MTELEEKIYNVLLQTGTYYYAVADLHTKNLEVKAIESLATQGYIHIHANALGYCIADVI